MPNSTVPGRLLDRRLETLLATLPAARKGDEASVHQARVASRRLREALPIVAAGAARGALRRARRDARRITRALGPVREIDVALGHLEEVAGRELAPAAAIARVRTALTRERRQRRRGLLDDVTPSRIERLQKRVATLRADAPPPAIERARALAEAGRRVDRRAGRLTVAMDRAGGLYLPDRLHEVRIAAKKLRYTLETRGELERSRAAVRIRRLKDLQGLLGRMHDLEILIDHVRAVQAEMAVSARSLGTALDAVVRALEAECRELHGSYVGTRFAR